MEYGKENASHSEFFAVCNGRLTLNHSPTHIHIPTVPSTNKYVHKVAEERRTTLRDIMQKILLN